MDNRVYSSLTAKKTTIEKSKKCESECESEATDYCSNVALCDEDVSIRVIERIIIHMNPVRSFESSDCDTFNVRFPLVVCLRAITSEWEARASYLPAKARAKSATSKTNVVYLSANRARYLRAFGRWQAGF